MNISSIVVLIFLASQIAQSQEYVYPVALFPHNAIATVHQHDSQAIELVTMDSTTQKITSAISTRFMPTCLQLLPDQSGFIFIDNGLVYKKIFYKRSPQAMEFSDPFYEINSIIGDSDAHLLISAKQKNKYAILYVDRNGSIIHTLSHKNTDFLYPQKAGAKLFFISRSTDNSPQKFSVSVSEFDSFIVNSDSNFKNKKSNTLKKIKTVQCEKLSESAEEQNSLNNIDICENRLFDRAIDDIIDFGNQPIAFLAMETDTQGFVVAHPSHIETDSSSSKSTSELTAHVLFSYYSLYKENGVWGKKKLFDFAIPMSFLLKESNIALYEYMNPLLPKKIDDAIYYSHSANGNLNIYKYCLTSQATTPLTFADQPHEHCFCSIKVNDTLYCGGTVQDKDKIQLRVIA